MTCRGLARCALAALAEAHKMIDRPTGRPKANEARIAFCSKYTTAAEQTAPVWGECNGYPRKLPAVWHVSDVVPQAADATNFRFRVACFGSIYPRRLLTAAAKQCVPQAKAETTASKQA